MKSLKEIYFRAVDLLSKYKIQNPRLDIEVLMEHAFDIKRIFIVTNLDFLVEYKQEEKFWQMIEKRIQYYPISKIIGVREFWSLNFMVNKDVLDPRPDSETLIYTALNIYKNKNQRLKIVDLGTGTGCLLIALMLHYKNSIGYAFEKNINAYRVARENIIQHGLQNRIKIHLSSWNKCYGFFDLIISNPPYIRRNEIARLQPEVKLYDPITALDGGVSGLDSYLQILTIIARCLKKNGKAIIEIGESQKQISNLINEYGLKFNYYAYDFSHKKRCVVISKYL